ncbi:MAG TPA: sigma 54-interacting transcriptional regulator [Candidatus Krumholzibacteria bacterium]|nr:sigma 54-interacting transcriptional regulator [Candidatus Krumholzibacteria bacterium]
MSTRKTPPPTPRKPAAPSTKKPAPRNRLEDFREWDRTLRASRPPAASPTAAPAPPATPDAEAQRRFDELRKIVLLLGTAVDLKETLDRVVDGILVVARCERGFVILMDAADHFATYTGRRKDQGEWDKDDARAISSTIVNAVIANGQPVIHSDLQEVDDLRERGSIQAGKIRAAVCLPVVDDERLIGVIYADHRFVTPRYTQWDRSFLQFFALQAAFAIGNARRKGELKHQGDRLAEENAALARQLFREFAMGGTISKSPAMLDVFEMVTKVAPDDITVLIQGESGTGKDGVARAIHARSRRREGPFCALSCGSIAANLVESTLFGYVRGAFTNADADRPGFFEAAQGGTLFLDEIGTMPLSAQVALLRVLENREFSRVGDVRVQRADVRVISATNRDLERAVAEGEFREDLYYRLNQAKIEVPALRERPEDIIPIAEHFLDQYAKNNKQMRPYLSGEAKAILLGHSWPGNVRELKSAIEGAILFRSADNSIDAKALERFISSRRGAPSGESSPVTLRAVMERAEEQAVRQALAQHGNNVTLAAQALDLSRQQLYNKIRKYGIALRLE